MDLIPKDKETNEFYGGMDSDTSPQDMAPNRARYMLNVRTTTKGQKASITNIKGNTMVSTPLPAGNNIPLGWGADEQNNQFYFIVYNDQGFHTVFLYDSIKKSVISLLQSRTDSNDVDILMLDPAYLINHVDIIPGINGPMPTWSDGKNKAVKFNRNMALDKTLTGYGLDIQRDFVVAYKKPSIFAPTCVYFTDVTRTSNFLYGKLFKFVCRFYYYDGEQSNYSDFSLVALPPNQSFSGINNITYDNNAIAVSVATGSREVVKIEVAMKVGTNDFVTVVILDKATLKITDDSFYTYNFYNDGAELVADQNKVNRQYSFLPDKPYCQSFVQNAMTYSKFFEGFPAVPVNVEVDVTYSDLFIPDGTSNQLNSPVFNAQLITNGYSSGSLGVNKRYNAEWKFTVGFDVKAGNVFKMIGTNGGSANFNFSYTATAEDDAITVANAFKAKLRGIGRGVPDAGNGISNEGVDGDNNQFFSYTILGYWNESPVNWVTSVTPVSFETLKDDGTSVNLHKPGSTVKYAIAYEDDDTRKGNANTSDACVAYTGFITETGDQKRATHRVIIKHAPPAWARYYYLLRTIESGPWIQMLIQKVIDVDPDPTEVAAGNSQRYLDLVVGSLFTYQKLHPNTVISYDFAKQDRIRPIKFYDPTTFAKTLYPFIELEVLSYNINTQEVVNANVTCNGTATITIGALTNASYVGKLIVFNGYERTIVAVPSGNSYTLDKPVPDGTLTTSVSFPTFTYSDQRGILRIKRPDNTILFDLSLVEIYKPQVNEDVNGYKQFYPFGIKLEIGNYRTPQAYHAGTVQDQFSIDSATPAIIDVIQGDAYERNRELPTNDIVPGTQLIIDHITDPNFSDTYESDLSNLGRIFPQDDGSGQKWFGSRTRYSNNFIEDTKINGLADFDNLDRKDYDDPFGDIMLTKFDANKLLIFKYLKTAWAAVRQQRIESADGGGTMTTVGALLSNLEYYEWDGGIGNNPESYVRNGNYKYFASAATGVFLRLSKDGLDPVSTIYDFDKAAREILTNVAKFNLRLFGGFDRLNTEIIWSVPAYKNFIFNGNFQQTDWNIYNDALPEGTTFEITQQPANSSVAIDGGGMFQLTTGNVLGPDYFVYRAILPNSTALPARRECFTVAVPANSVFGWQAQQGSAYCLTHGLGFAPQLSSAYCEQESTGWQAKAGTVYCVKRYTGFSPKLDSAYCEQSATSEIPDFDFLQVRYLWDAGDGNDLDSITGLQGTGTIYDGVTSSRENWVGFNQNPDPSTGITGSGSRVIPYGAGSPYLNWGADSESAPGKEAILFDKKKFITDFPTTPSPITIRCNAVWYQSIGDSDVVMEVTAWKGGTMSLDGTNKNFINTGGTRVLFDNFNIQVTVQSKATLIGNSQDIAQISYNKTTHTGKILFIV